MYKGLGGRPRPRPSVHVNLLELGLELRWYRVNFLLGLLFHEPLPAAADVLAEATETRSLIADRLHKVILETKKTIG